VHATQILAEPVRRRIIEILASGEHSSGELSDAIGREFSITRQAVSHHLSIMMANDWLLMEREWTTNLYRLNPDALRLVHAQMDWLDHLWGNRYGWRERNDPHMHSAHPFTPRPYPRPPVGESRRGLRGRRRDPWAPNP
jgi:DNA-binding transcriptional ArsR family regulator